MRGNLENALAKRGWYIALLIAGGTLLLFIAAVSWWGGRGGTARSTLPAAAAAEAEPPEVTALRLELPARRNLIESFTVDLTVSREHFGSWPEDFKRDRGIPHLRIIIWWKQPGYSRTEGYHPGPSAEEPWVLDKLTIHDLVRMTSYTVDPQDAVGPANARASSERAGELVEAGRFLPFTVLSEFESSEPGGLRWQVSRTLLDGQHYVVLTGDNEWAHPEKGATIRMTLWISEEMGNTVVRTERWAVIELDGERVAEDLSREIGSDFREVAPGLFLPRKFTLHWEQTPTGGETRGGKRTWDFLRVEVNQPIDDSVFKFDLPGVAVYDHVEGRWLDD